MNDDSDWYEEFGASVERPAWSWSYLRKPTVLFLWLGCAALSAVLADGKKQQPQPHVPAEAMPAPPPQSGLHIVQGDVQATGRIDRDEDARAA
jgi:hypothetical protein